MHQQHYLFYKHSWVIKKQGYLGNLAGNSSYHLPYIYASLLCGFCLLFILCLLIVSYLLSLCHCNIVAIKALIWIKLCDAAWHELRPRSQGSSIALHCFNCLKRFRYILSAKWEIFHLMLKQAFLCKLDTSSNLNLAGQEMHFCKTFGLAISLFHQVMQLDVFLKPIKFQ